MRHLLFVISIVGAAGYCTVALGQPLYTLQDMINNGIRLCMSQHVGQANAESFCTCDVNRWVGLWDDNDREVWTRTAVATPHMQQMEAVAAAQCAGR